MSGPLPAQERVLPTLNADGSRRRVRPKLYKGKYYRARLITAWGLIALFVALPFIYINGKPAILLDVAARRFSLFGRTFLATDGILLMLLMITIFLSVIWLTALVGRAWCGWGCPQTVYMEFVFRPIERLFEGDRAAQMRLDKRGGLSLRRLLKYPVFLVLSVFVANVFLAYFVGVERLWLWVRQSPYEHPVGFLVMGVTAALVMFDFAYFREQMCTVICPYARIQSVLLDDRSLIVGYDARRGEPRVKGKPKEGMGDCIDCNACVVTCPTGIDIREGLQLECITCTQCVDACDSIMDKIGKPRGLVRYSSQTSLETGKKTRIARVRVVIYPVLIFVFASALVFFLMRGGSADVTVLRGIGAPYVLQADSVRNQLRIKVENRTSDDHKYKVELLDAADAQLIAPENPLPVRAGRHETTSIFVVVPKATFSAGKRTLKLRISDDADFSTERTYQLLGP
ncbi:MAG: cytochrome c oxidase accessory protein CcoG [Polyangiaceae bacterium]